MDSASALRHVDPRVADVLFILTLTNSVVNPYVYGSYASETRTKCFKWFGMTRRRRNRGSGSTAGGRAVRGVVMGHRCASTGAVGGANGLGVATTRFGCGPRAVGRSGRVRNLVLRRGTMPAAVPANAAVAMAASAAVAGADSTAADEASMASGVAAPDHSLSGALETNITRFF